MKILFLSFVFFTFAFSVYSQTELPIIGAIAEIKNFKKVYIQTESTKDRTFILQALKKKKSALEVVNDPSSADFFLEFKTLAHQDKKTLGGSQYTEDGEMTAYYFNKDKKKVVAWSKSKQLYVSGGIQVTSPPSYALTRDFVNALVGKN